MTYNKILSMCAALALTAGGLFAMTPAAVARERPVVVIAPASDLPTRRVSYADLNLASLAGEKTLLTRVSRAVKWVCMESVGPSPLYYAEQGCRSYAWRGARPQIDRAMQRHREIASTGTSLIAVAAISIAAPR